MAELPDYVVLRTAPDERFERLAALVRRYCPVDSLVPAAMPDYEITCERMA